MKNYPWLKSYPKSVDWDHMIDSKPVYRLLNDAVKKYPENIAIDFFGNEISYVDLKSLVNRAAKGLRNIGVKKGIRVGILLPNCPQYIISYYAILRAGGVVVQLSPLLSEKELLHQINDSGAEIIITTNLRICYEKIAAITNGSNVNKVVVSKFSEYLPTLKSIGFQLLRRSSVMPMTKDGRQMNWSQLLVQDDDDEFEAEVINPEKDIAVLQYTGGTTGLPKAAMLTHANVYANAIQCVQWCYELEKGKERMLAVLPFFHVFAMTVVMNLSIEIGATIILHPKFVLLDVLKDIVKKRPTLMPGVPTMFNAINTHPKLSRFDLTSLKLCVSGGAPLLQDIKEKFEKKTGCILIEGYGLTEAAPVVCFNPISGNHKDGSIGLPMPQTTVTIEDPKNPGTNLPIGEVGELCVKGPQVMKGYWNNSSETENVLNNGKLRTGDLAKIDKDGYVYIVDRLKEMIITGGFNVFPRNVEEAIQSHKSVKECAVVGVGDKHKGQLVKAYIVFEPGQEISKDGLKNFLKDKLSKYEIPQEIEIIEELPKTMIGKISKKDLMKKNP